MRWPTPSRPSRPRPTPRPRRRPSGLAGAAGGGAAGAAARPSGMGRTTPTPAAEVAEGPRYEDLPASFPSERLALGSEDLTLRAIEWLTPFGKGSRVAIVGGARAGKTEALLRLAAALAPAAESGGYELSVTL